MGNQPLEIDPAKQAQPTQQDRQPWLFYDLGENNALPWQKYLDKNATGMAQDIAQRAGIPSDPQKVSGIGPGGVPYFTQNEHPEQNYFNVEQMRGVEPGQIGNASNVGAMNGGSAMSQAIARKYQGQVDQKFQGMKTQQQINAPITQSNESKRAADIYGMQQKQRVQNFQEQYAYQSQRAQLYQQYLSAQDQAKSGYIASAIGVVATIGAIAASDERLKKNISPANGQIQGFLNSVKAWEYEYKNPAYGTGRYVSPMAQELEKTDLGKSMVINTPQGKMVDYARGLGTILAALSQINERLSKLERK